MAQLTLEQIRNQTRTSIYGRRLMLDITKDEINAVGGSVMRGGMLGGMPGIKLPIQKITTTGGSTIYPSGYVELSATTASSAINTLANPIPGVELTLFMSATSTLGHVVQSAGNGFMTSLGSSQNQITFTGQGQSARLIGISTGLWEVIPGTTSGISFSTF